MCIRDRIISIESTQVATTITVKDADGLLGDGAVTLTNMKDTADVHSFKSGEAVSLTIGEVYKVSCAVNNAIIKINNSTISVSYTHLGDEGIPREADSVHGDLRNLRYAGNRCRESLV